MVRMVKIEADGEKQAIDVATITRPDDLVEIAHLGLSLADGKRLLAGLQQEIVAAQARDHAVRRPNCRSCGEVCRVKDYRDHAVATLFGRVTLRLPRFRCGGCGGSEAGHAWPSHCRSTPELDQLQAHLAALMPYRVAADVVAQMFPVGAGNGPETLRCRTLKIGAELRDQPAVRPDAAAALITVSLDSTFIRSCQEGERHLEVRVGNVETAAGGRQVFGAVAKAVDRLACAGWLSQRPERVAGQLCRTAPRRITSWHRHHRRDGQFPGEPSDEQVPADALVATRG